MGKSISVTLCPLSWTPPPSPPAVPLPTQGAPAPNSSRVGGTGDDPEAGQDDAAPPPSLLPNRMTHNTTRYNIHVMLSACVLSSGRGRDCEASPDDAAGPPPPPKVNGKNTTQPRWLCCCVCMCCQVALARTQKQVQMTQQVTCRASHAMTPALMGRWRHTSTCPQ
jgi:hypothetical protein